MTKSNPLTKREWEVLKLLLQGKSNKMIASSLDISERTVEFHLKNMYAKFQVSTRIELILELGKTQDLSEIAQLWESTVASRGKRAENREKVGLQDSRTGSLVDIFTVKESNLKTDLRTPQVFAGVSASLLTGFSWVALLGHFGHMSFSKIAPWIPLMAIVLISIGLFVGIAAKRVGDTPGRALLGGLLGTGVGAFAMIPIMGFVVYPLVKLMEGAGLIDRAMISTDTSSTLVIFALMVIWLLVGITIGTMVLFIRFKAPGSTTVHGRASEHGV